MDLTECEKIKCSDQLSLFSITFFFKRKVRGPILQSFLKVRVTLALRGEISKDIFYLSNKNYRNS